MRSLIRTAVLTFSVSVLCWGIPGCAPTTESDQGKMAGPMDKMDSGKMAGPMDKMDSGKMAGPMDKMDSGKMATEKK
jgi:hypothetical protein